MADRSGIESELRRMTADVVAAYVSRNAIPAAQIAEVVQAVHGSLRGLGASAPALTPTPALKPAVPIKKSVTADYLISLEDGRKLKSLKRHLRTRHGLTPEQYRAKWGLPSNYPMVAPNYSVARSDFAKKIGLGRKPGQGGARRNRR